MHTSCVRPPPSSMVVITWPLRDVQHAIRTLSVQGGLLQPPHARARRCIASQARGYSDHSGARDLIDPSKSIELPGSDAAPQHQSANPQPTAGEPDAPHSPQNAGIGGRRGVRSITRDSGARGSRQYEQKRRQNQSTSDSGYDVTGSSSRQLRAVGRGRARGKGRSTHQSRDRYRQGPERGGVRGSQVGEEVPACEEVRIQDCGASRPHTHRNSDSVRRKEMGFEHRAQYNESRQRSRRNNGRGWASGRSPAPHADDVWAPDQGEWRGGQDMNAWRGRKHDREHARYDRPQGRNSRLRTDGRRQGWGAGGRGRARGRDGRGRGKPQSRSSDKSTMRQLSPEQLRWQTALSSYKLEGMRARQDEAYQRMIASLHSTRDAFSTNLGGNAAQSGAWTDFDSVEAIERGVSAQSGEFEMQFSSMHGGGGGGSCSWLEVDDDMGMYEADVARFMPEDGSSSSWWTGADTAASHGAPASGGGAVDGFASRSDTSDSWWLPEDGAANADDTDGELDALLDLLGGMDVVDKPVAPDGCNAVAAQRGSTLQDGDADQHQGPLSDSGILPDKQEPLSVALHTPYSNTLNAAEGIEESDAPRWAQAWDSSQAKHNDESSYRTMPPVVPRHVPKVSSAAVNDGDMLMDMLDFQS